MAFIRPLPDSRELDYSWKIVVDFRCQANLPRPNLVDWTGPAPNYGEHICVYGRMLPEPSEPLRPVLLTCPRTRGLRFLARRKKHLEPHMIRKPSLRGGGGGGYNMVVA